MEITEEMLAAVKAKNITDTDISQLIIADTERRQTELYFLVQQLEDCGICDNRQLRKLRDLLI